MNYLVLLFLLILIACESNTSDESVNSGELDPADYAVITEHLNLPEDLDNYTNPNRPAHYLTGTIRNTDNTPRNNPMTDAGATLGRVLFYDTKLSKNNTVACASCHVQADGFSDRAQFSEGFEGSLTGRNSMGLGNATFYEKGHFFWDERAASLEDQVLMPIQDETEMGMTLDSVVTRVESHAYYRILFARAFGDSAVTSTRISRSMAQFIRAMESTDSKFDRALINHNGNVAPNTQLTGLTAQENRGRQVFLDRNLGACAGCHGTDAFIAEEALNNGLDATTTDEGLGAVSGNTNDDGKFKVPSLKNIALTAPYMHDGRFASLEDVIEHYNSGVQAHPNLDNRLKIPGTNQPRRLNLSASDKAALAAFLRTLTDETLTTDEKFSDPFKD